MASKQQLEKAVEEMRLYLGSVDYSSLKDQQRRYKRVSAQVAKVADAAKIEQVDAWEQIEAEARRRGIKRPIPGQHMNPERKIVALSKDRYRASADERRRYGGNIITEYYVFFADEEGQPGAAKVITGYGKSAADRKRDAIEKFKAMQTKTNPTRSRSGRSKTPAFVVGDRVRLRPDALQQHARGVPAHMGYSREQFQWRDTLRRVGDEIGVVERVFDSGYVNVDFPSASIGIDGSQLMMATKTNPGRRHMACGDLSKKRCDQLNEIYESNRARGYSKKRSAQIARGVVRKQVAKDKRTKKNPGRGRRRNPDGPAAADVRTRMLANRLASGG